MPLSSGLQLAAKASPRLGGVSMFDPHRKWVYYAAILCHLYRLARPRARWYQLGGDPLVGLECVYSQCNSSFVITRGGAMPSAADLPAHISRAHKKRQQRRWNSVKVLGGGIECPLQVCLLSRASVSTNFLSRSREAALYFHRTPDSIWQLEAHASIAFPDHPG